MRHAKSAYPPGVRDHDRPLADRGTREAGLAGEWLRAHVPRIDQVLLSTSARTKQTVEAAGIAAPSRLAAEIFEATPDDILEQITQTAEIVATLLVVGHSPGVPGLAMELADHTSDPVALDALHSRFPTSAIAVLDFRGDWSALEPDSCRLTAVHIPRD